MFTKLARNRSGDISAPRRGPLAAPLTGRGVQGRKLLKKFLYSQLALRQALMIALGKEQPIVRFTVEAEPPSVYWVFRVRADAATLARRLQLPDHLAPTPIRCLRDDEPELLIALNVYRVSGLARGLRAEWSVFVADDAGTPRYLVFDARSSEFSMDPVEIITRRSTVEHVRQGSTITTRVGDDDDAFRATVAIDENRSPRVETAAEWASANDFIYWCNGICDRTYYDATMADAAVRDIPADAVSITDGTVWADLLDPEPAHVLVYEHAIEIAISPWENLDRLHP